MWKYRVIYACVFVAAGLFTVIYPLWFPWYLFISILLLGLFDLAISLPGMFSRHISFEVPKVIEQSSDAVLVFTTSGKNRFPAKCIKVRLKVSCEEHAFRRRLVLGAQDGDKVKFNVAATNSGIIVFEIKRIWVVSLLGLFCFPARFSHRASSLVLPSPAESAAFIALPQSILLKPKPGGGFSDEHDLRPFRFGDDTRSVHWKVSAKLDLLIAREPLAPLHHSLLVQVGIWAGAQERDIILSRLCRICEDLLKLDLPHHVSLDISGTYAEIKQITNLYDYLFHVLDGTFENDLYPRKAPAEFVRVYHIDAAQ